MTKRELKEKEYMKIKRGRKREEERVTRSTGSDRFVSVAQRCL